MIGILTKAYNRAVDKIVTDRNKGAALVNDNRLFFLFISYNRVIRYRSIAAFLSPDAETPIVMYVVFGNGAFS